MKKAERIISLLLAFLIAVSLLPGTALADFENDAGRADAEEATESCGTAVTEETGNNTDAPEASSDTEQSKENDNGETAGITEKEAPASGEEEGNVFLFNDIFSDIIDEDTLVEELLSEETVFESMDSGTEDGTENAENLESGVFAAPLNLLKSVFVPAAYAEEDPQEIYAYCDTEAAELLRKAMVGREEKFEIIVRNTGDEPEVIAKNIVSMASAHTGVPTEGDYIAWQGLRAAWSCDETEEYISFIFFMNYFTTAGQECEVDAKVEEILDELDVYTADVYAKVKAVYDYVAGSVYYDSQNISSPSAHTAYAGFMENRCVCQGYALMVYRLLLELEVDVRLITGYGDGSGHAWNLIGIDGVYYHSDPTWDAGTKKYYSTGFTGSSALYYTFFLDGTDHFLRRHYPKCFFIDGTSTKPSEGNGIYIYNCDVSFYNVSETPYYYGSYALPSENKVSLSLNSNESESESILFTIDGELPDSYSVKCVGVNSTQLAKTQISELEEGKFTVTFSTNSRRGYAEYAIYILDNETGMPSGSISIIQISVSNPDKQIITVTFDAGEGTGGPVQQTLETGLSLRLSTQVPERTGYVFDHWEKRVTDPETGEVTKTSYKPGANCSFSEDTTLYAVYLGKKYSQYTLSFNPNGGSCKAESVTVYYRESYGQLPEAENGNRIFLGWYTASVGGIRITEDSQVTRTSDHVLYAHWGPAMDWSVSSELSVLRPGESTQLVINGTEDTNRSNYTLKLGIDGDFDKDTSGYVSLDDNGVLTALKPGIVISVKAEYEEETNVCSKDISIRLLEKRIQIEPSPDTEIFTSSSGIREGWFGLDCCGNIASEEGETVGYAVYLEKSSKARSFTFNLALTDEDGSPVSYTPGSCAVKINTGSICSGAVGKDGQVNVSVKANATGACTLDVYLKNNKTVSERLQIYVIDLSPHLDTNKITINTCTETPAQLRLVSSYGNEISSDSLVYYAKSSNNGKYTDLSDVFEFCLDGELLSVNTKKYCPDATYTGVLSVCCSNTEYDAETGKPVNAYELPLKIVIKNKKAVLRPADKNITLNLLNPEMAVETETVLNSEGITIDSIASAELEPVYRSSDAGKLDVTYADGVIKASFKYDNGILQVPQKGSYSFTFTPVSSIKGEEIELSAVRITIKVQETTPAIALGSSTLQLNRNFSADSAECSVALAGDLQGFTLSSLYGFTCRNVWGFSGVSFEVIDNGLDADSELYEITGFNASFSKVSSAKKYNYLAYADILCPNGSKITKTLLFSVVVSGSEPQVNLSASSVNLNALYAGEEENAITLNLQKENMYFESLDIKPTGKAAEEAEKIIWSIEKDEDSGRPTGKITIGLSEEDPPKTGTYSFEITPNVNGDDFPESLALSPQKITVRVISRADISASVSVSGKLDAVNRSGSRVRFVLNKLNYISGEVTGAKLEGEDADKFIFCLTENEKGNKEIIIKLKSAAEVSTEKIYRVIPTFVLENGIRVSAPVQKIKITQSRLSLSVSPSSAVYFQSQGRNRTIEYTIKLLEPSGAAITEDSISIGKTNFWQRSLEKQAKSVDIAVTGNTVTVRVTLKDTARFITGSQYYLPVLITPGNAAVNAAATKVNLGMLIKK